jgi:glutathione S-transferase
VGADPPERIFHIATVADWEAAQVVGDYRVSTLGRSLEQEGFLHASHADQWQAVYDAFYAGLDEPLVLLEIDPGLLGVPVVEEAPPGTDKVFPHIYGPLPVGAVVGTRAL